MRGFVTIDRQPGANIVAVWVSARVGGGGAERELETEQEDGPSGTAQTLNVNAVVIDQCEDPLAIEKVRSLTRSSVVVATAGSDLEGLPIAGEPLRTLDFDALLDETEVQQRRIEEALVAYATRVSPKTGKLLKPKNMARPRWAPRPDAAQFEPCEDSAAHRALATANFVRAAWQYWLSTDEERRVRAKPSGRTPSRMTPELRSPMVTDFPPRFAASLQEQALV